MGRQTKKYRTGLIGCGNMGSLYDEESATEFPLSHAEAFSMHAAFNLECVCDVDAQRLAAISKNRGIKSLFLTSEEMFRKSSLDIVIIATPPSFSPGHVRNAIEAGISLIVVEKPVSTTSSELLEIKKLVERSDSQIIVNYPRIWSDGFSILNRSLLRENIGQIQLVNCLFGKGIMNSGTHMIHLLLSLFGSPSRASRTSGLEFADTDTDNNDPTFSFRLDFSRVDYLFSAKARATDHTFFSVFEIDIVGTKGRIQINNGMDNVLVSNIASDPRYPNYRILNLLESHSNLGQTSLVNLVKESKRILDGTSETANSGLDICLETLKTVEQLKESVIG